MNEGGWERRMRSHVQHPPSILLWAASTRRLPGSGHERFVLLCVSGAFCTAQESLR